MIDPTQAFHGFAVPDIDAARAFYADVLGLEVDRGGRHAAAVTSGSGTEDARLPQAEPRSRRRTRSSTSRCPTSRPPSTT